MRYLLGELTEEECDQLEETCFATPEGFEELEAVEQELMDAYVAGELSPERRLRFESRLVPGEHGEVQFARALKAALRDRPPSVARAGVRGRRGLSAWLPAAAAALFMAAGGWLVLRTPGAPPVSPPSGEQQPTPVGPSPTATSRATGQVDRSRSMFVTLTAGLTRNESGLRRIVVPAEVERVVFTLVVEGEARTRYGAVLQNASGEDLLEVKPVQERAAVQARLVDVPVPARALADGDYVLQLQSHDVSGRTEDLAEYAFRVARK